MKQLFFLLLLLCFSSSIYAQDSTLKKRIKFFENELKPWTSSFENFNVADFKKGDTLTFFNNSPQDSSDLPNFLAIHKPIISYSPDGLKFIDIYSYQLNLEKQKDFYQASISPDQSINLYHQKKKYWNRILFGGPSFWIDEVVWTSNFDFILAGVEMNEKGIKAPVLFYGNANKQFLVKYINSNSKCIQNEKGYHSSKLANVKIKGL